MSNAWLEHVKQFKQQNASLSFKDLLKAARKSYKGGSGVSPYAASVGVARYATTVGGRSRRNRKSRRKSRRSNR